MSCDLKKVHETELKILKEIDRICRKYRIKYMMDAGTLLGAVRHKGFIPWDDDADLVFTRRNYEAFLKVVRRELPDTMELITPDSFAKGTRFFDFTARIIYKRSKVHEDSAEMAFYEGRLNHLWVDLFILDELPECKYCAAATLLAQKTIYGMAMGHRRALDYSKYSTFHKLAVGGLATVGRLIPMKALFVLQRMVSLMSHKSGSRLRYYSNYQPDYLYVTLQKEWCENIVDLDFEDTKLMAPKNWDDVLTWIYGDYMTPPPEDKRVPLHSSMQILVDEELDA